MPEAEIEVEVSAGVCVVRSAVDEPVGVVSGVDEPVVETCPVVCVAEAAVEDTAVRAGISAKEEKEGE